MSAQEQFLKFVTLVKVPSTPLSDIQTTLNWEEFSIKKKTLVELF